MQKIGTTPEGRQIVVLETTEANLLAAIVPMLNAPVEIPAPQVALRPPARPRKKSSFTGGPVLHPKRGPSPFPAYRDPAKIPLRVRIEKAMRTYGRPMRCGELASELKVRPKAVAGCCIQNPQRFQKVAYGTYTLKDPSLLVSKSLTPLADKDKKAARLAAIRAANARLVAAESDPLAKAASTAAQIRSEEQ